jgi:ArsR family transcriptional regulator, arsenate/arsenite/antimonite-responsive transcriptional repressor
MQKATDNSVAQSSWPGVLAANRIALHSKGVNASPAAWKLRLCRSLDQRWNDEMDVLRRLQTLLAATEIAIADPTRLRILNLVLGGELCVCDIVNALRIPQPTVSRHLAYLRRAGLVEARRAGLWIHYKLAAPQTMFHKKLIECLGCCFQDVPQLAKDTKQLKRYC